MSERLSAETQTRKVTPLDLAKAAMRRRGIDIEVPQPEARAQAGDIVEHNGVQYIYVPSFRSTTKRVDGKRVDARVPYTYRQYYSHSFEDPETGQWEPAPGWDTKFGLMDDEKARRRHGRAFTNEELKDLPNNLPEDVALFCEPMDSYEVEEYLETLNQ